jgi:pimeloyl-ACP methyl ester carboxylesterase
VKVFPLRTLRTDLGGPLLVRLTRTFWLIAIALAAIPFAAYALAAAPQSSLPLTIFSAALMIIVSIVTCRYFIRQPNKGAERLSKIAVTTLVGFGVLYLVLFGTFTFEVPGTHVRFGIPWISARGVGGFVCKADLTNAEKRECPFFGPNSLAGTGYQADDLWEPYSVHAVVLALVLGWLGTFVSMAVLNGSQGTLLLKRQWFAATRRGTLSEAQMSEVGGKCVRKSNSETRVVFVHGILSNGEQAWMNGSGAWWPKLLAAGASIDASIYTFTYRSDVLCRTYSLADVVASIREFFNLDELWNTRRIIFVCHSMGGIVVRRFIVQNQARFIERHTEIGLFLVASPSLGSRDANIVAGLVDLIGNSQAEALKFSQKTVWLNELDQDFITLKESDRFRIVGKELVEDQALKQKRWLGLFRQTVEPFSAARYFGEPYKVPWSDHSSIAKPIDASAIQHRQLLRFIRDMCAWVPPADARPHPIEQWEKDTARDALVALHDGLARRQNIPREVVVVFNDALMETRRYIADQKHGSRRDLAKENRLSTLWSEASAVLWRYDPDLASRCMIKGNGWADDAVWDDPRYRDLPLKLNDMMERMLQVAGDEARDVVDGECDIDVSTGRARVMLPPFKTAPQITLSKVGPVPPNDPTIQSVTPDQFTITISNSNQAGKYKWRARGTLLH